MNKVTHHSEYSELKSVYIKPVSSAFISDELLSQQWEELNYLSKPEFGKAVEEYECFENSLKASNVTVCHFPFDKDLSIDSVYCRDASIATDFGVIICNMGKEGRRLEPQSQRIEYLEKNISILGEIVAPGTLEGGDVAWLDEKTLAVGHTYRTNEEGISQLKNLLEPHGVEVVVAELPHYKGASDVFHLMSILSPVAKDLAVVYSPLMPIKFRNELIKRGFKFVEVPEDEFDSMGCNVLAVAPRKCIMVEGNPKTKKALEAAGCEVFAYKGDEISVKGGGGPTCLTRPLLRSY
ncbi:MAG: N-dimethylarginine dimethylaminohydrolase [Vicingaceae bacterium]|jgi:N-dimethylarginine dimethylaminohydrolase